MDISLKSRIMGCTDKGNNAIRICKLCLKPPQRIWIWNLILVNVQLLSCYIDWKISTRLKIHTCVLNACFNIFCFISHLNKCIIYRGLILLCVFNWWKSTKVLNIYLWEFELGWFSIQTCNYCTLLYTNIFELYIKKNH